jgi:alpha-tubulin suppressor-like RCC1 family protein
MPIISTLANASTRGYSAGIAESAGRLFVWGAANSNNEFGVLESAAYYTDPVSPPHITNSDYTSIRIGQRHGLARKSNGTLWAWGLNTSGQVGSGVALGALVTSPVQIGAGTDWTDEFDCGVTTSYAVKSDGTLWAWGLGTSGQLGDGSVISKNSPIQVGALTNWARVAGGNTFVISVKTDGTMWAWGAGTQGELGTTTAVSRSSPVQIGALTTWFRPLAGANNGGAINTSNQLWMWGLGTSGQLANNAAVDRSSPVQISGTFNRSLPSVVSIGVNFTLAVDTSGALTAWGLGTSGQLGENAALSRSNPVNIAGSWSSVAAGNTAGIAIRANGTLWGWGSQGSTSFEATGTIPTFTFSSPVQISSSTSWSYITSSNKFSTLGWQYGVDNGLAQVWGRNIESQTGYTYIPSRTYLSPVLLASPTMKIIANYGNEVSAIGVNKQLYAWGINQTNGLGPTSGTLITWASSSPRLVTTSDWKDVNTGSGFSIALREDGYLFGWGINSSGQLAQNNNVNYSSPVQIGVSLYSKVDVGGSYVAAIRSDGLLFSWGIGTSGELGNNQAVTQSNPVQVAGGQSWVEVACCASTTAAIRTNGTLWAWGIGTSGERGSGAATNVSSPVQIGSLSWLKVSGIANTFHAIRSDGTLWGWGVGTSGQLGNNTAVNVSSPVQVGSFNDWVDFGKSESAQNIQGAFRSNGLFYAWGNAQGFTSSPVQVGSTAPTYASLGASVSGIVTT